MKSLFPFKPTTHPRWDAQTRAIIEAHAAYAAETKPRRREALLDAYHQAQRNAVLAGMSTGDVIGLVYDLQMHARDPRRCACAACATARAA